MASSIEDKKFFRFTLIDVDGKEYEVKPSEESLEKLLPLTREEITYKLMKLFIQN
ncbi:MAG: hypothetical protein QXS37_06520 [Candidatus Aenigmatarchaeota archaeon]